MPNLMMHVQVELCVLTISQGQLSVVVMRRSDEPTVNETAELGSEELASSRWRLLGSPLLGDADADATALRLLATANLAPKTSQASIQQSSGGLENVVEQLRTYAYVPECGERRTVSIAYFALVTGVARAIKVSDTLRVFAVDDLLSEPGDFADVEVLEDAVERVRSKLEYTSIATSLLPEPFTIPELRRVYEAVWGTTLHPANFRRKVLATDGFVVPVAETTATSVPKGPDLFARGKAALLHPAMLRTPPS